MQALQQCTAEVARAKEDAQRKAREIVHLRALLKVSWQGDPE